MSDPFEQAERAQRAPALQEFLDAFAKEHEISDSFAAATAHPYTCKCDKCRDWWANMGPDDDNPEANYAFGPFSRKEIEDYCVDAELPIFWAE